jgi:putative FmdB family regulatory protein
MPVYEYKCRKCGAEFTYLKLRAMDEPACPKCKSGEVGKKMSSFSCSGSSGSSSGSGVC